MTLDPINELPPIEERAWDAPTKTKKSISGQVVNWLRSKDIGFRFTRDDAAAVVNDPKIKGWHGSITGVLRRLEAKGILESRLMAGDDIPDLILTKSADEFPVREKAPIYTHSAVRTKSKAAPAPEPVTLDSVRDRLLELATDIETLANHKLENVSTDDLLAELKLRMK